MQDGTVLADCRVANQSFATVGVTSVQVPGAIFDADDGVELTWTVGLDSYENVDPEKARLRNLERVYYLGTPSDVDFTGEDSGVGGCAV